MAKSHGITGFAASRQVHQRAGNGGRGANRNGCRAHHGVVQFTHRQRPHQQIHILHLDRFAAGRHVIRRCRYKGDFRGVLAFGGLFHRADQPHAQRPVGPDGFKHGQGLGITVDVALQFRAAVTNVAGIDENSGNASIDHSHVQGADAGYVQLIDHMPGGEHGATGAVFIRRRIKELQLHFGGRKRNAIQLKIARFLHG